MKRAMCSMTALLLAVCLLVGCGAPAAQSAAAPSQPAEPASASTRSESELPAEQTADSEYRAMWISYLEWQHTDFSTEAAFRAEAAQMMQNCADLGLNTVIAQVRAFADALYPSRLFPWSESCTGIQGGDPGFDPLKILVEEAHARNLRLEAWVNPYRVAISGNPSGKLAENNLANNHVQWIKQAEGGMFDGLYLDPSSSEVQSYILDGVKEILDGHAVDGIHFDDYFYPTTDPAFDAEEYARQGSGLSLDDWRRQNVNTLVQKVYDLVKAHDPHLTFGISPQGNPDNNYNGQYSDVGLWMQEGGYVDYVAPQLYWGFDYTLKSGSDRFAYQNISAEWAAMERSPSVSLCFGLGAYRIGEGDGCEATQTQWNSGHNLADMVRSLRETGVNGYALFRYDHLFCNDGYADLAAGEAAALKQINTGKA